MEKRTQKKPGRISLPLLFVTALGIGFIPVAPGTFGSLLPIFLLYAFRDSLSIITVILVLGACLIATFCLIPGVLRSYAIHEKTDKQKADPSYIVMDEVIGQLLTVLIIMVKIPLTAHSLLFALIAFRAFDIIKPWPIRHIEKTLEKTPRYQTVSIILDDGLAGLLAGTVVLVFLHFFPS